MGRTVEFKVGGGIELRAVSMKLIIVSVKDESHWVDRFWIFLCRRTASSSMDQSCSTLHASLTPQETCISTKVGRGTNSACVQMGLCSVCK